MANHKSAKKAHKKSIKRAIINKSRKRRIKTFITKVMSLSPQDESSAVRLLFSKAESEVMKGVTKGVLHLNSAARKVSKMARHIKSLEAA